MKLGYEKVPVRCNPQHDSGAACGALCSNCLCPPGADPLSEVAS